MLPSPYQNNLVALVVDDVHCVIVWGNTFRTTFAQIGDLRSLVARNVKIMVLTATERRNIFCCN